MDEATTITILDNVLIHNFSMPGWPDITLIPAFIKKRKKTTLIPGPIKSYNFGSIYIMHGTGILSSDRG